MVNTNFENKRYKTLQRMNFANRKVDYKEIEYKNKLVSAEFLKTTNVSEPLYELHSAFRTKNKTLITSDAGSGKTYAMMTLYKNYFRNIVDGRVDFINLIVVPLKSQAEQMKKEYGIECIVSQTKLQKNYNYNNNNTFCILPDTVPRVITMLNNLHSDVHVNLCIDEAHDLLVEARGYRDNALDNLDKLIKRIEEKRGSIAFMTATPDPLLLLDYNKHLHFQNTELTPKADKIGLIRANVTNKTYKEQLASYIEERIEGGYVPFVRLNNVQDIQFIASVLEEKGINCITLDSSQKSKVETFDVQNKKYEDVYRNEMYNSIIKESKLPEMSKGQKIQAYLTTSLIELGTNIIGVGEGPNSQSGNLLPIYACNDIKNTSITSVVQFLNRIRYQVNEYNVFIPQKDPSDMSYNIGKTQFPHFKTEEIFFPDQYKKAKYYLAEAKRVVDSGNRVFLRENVMKQYIRTLFEMNDVGNIKSNFNYITYDESTKSVNINMLKFAAHTYERFTNQYYYYQTDFINKISNYIKVPAFVKEYGSNQPKAIAVKQDRESKSRNFTEMKSYLSQISKSPKLMAELKEITKNPSYTINPERVVDASHIMDEKKAQAILDAHSRANQEPQLGFLECQNQPVAQSEEVIPYAASQAEVQQTLLIADAMQSREKISTEDYKILMRIADLLATKEGKQVATIIKNTDDTESVCQTIINCEKPKQLKTVYSDYVKENFIAKINMNSVRALDKYVAGEITMDELRIQLPADQYKVVNGIVTSTYMDYIRKAFRFNIDTFDILKIIKNATYNSHIDREITRCQHKFLNQLTAKGLHTLLCGIAATEHKIIYESLCEYNESGNLVQKTLTDEVIQKLANLLNIARAKFSSVKYSRFDVIQLCGYIFNLRERDGKYMIASLAL